MNLKNKVDPFDETLRLLWLKNAGNADPNTSAKELNFILDTNYYTDIDEAKEKLMIDKIFEKINTPSFGQLISETAKTKSISNDTIAEQSKLPVEIIVALQEDTIFPNNIPVRLFKNILNLLDISIDSAKKAIWKTFSIVKNREFTESHSLLLQPSFRHNNFSKQLSPKASNGTDGRELFENEDALKKYISKLNELMNQ